MLTADDVFTHISQEIIGWKTYLFTAVANFEVRVNKENVLRFEIGMS
jgi:hypothetical protein